MLHERISHAGKDLLVILCWDPDSVDRRGREVLLLLVAQGLVCVY